MTSLKTVFLLLCCLFAVSVQAEEIVRFTATYDVQPDGVVTVEEVIVYDFAGTKRRGIVRILDDAHAQPVSSQFKRRFVNIENLAVERAGAPEPFSISESKGITLVRIGDPDVTYTDQQTYRLTYDLLGALSYGPAGAELYWNATGNGWPVPIAEAVVTVRDATGTLLAAQHDCYVGLVERTTRCLIATSTPQMTVFTVQALAPYEGLTIAQSLNSEAVAVIKNEVWVFNFLQAGAALAWLIGFAVVAYRYRTAHKTSRPMVAQYEPYAGLLPMYTGVLFDGTVDPHDITAGIVYLAEQGYITIKKNR